MPPGTRHQTIMAARRQQVAHLYLKGEMQTQIAQRLGVDQSMISLDLKALRAAWLQSALRDWDALKSIELAKIDLVELEAWQAWERSKQPREVIVSEVTEGRSRRGTRRVEGQAGDPRYLAEVQKCIAKRCEILGLNAPQKTAFTSPDGTEAWEGKVIYLPTKAPSPEAWAAAVAQLQSPSQAEA
jgi:hypothetical protein